MVVVAAVGTGADSEATLRPDSDGWGARVVTADADWTEPPGGDGPSARARARVCARACVCVCVRARVWAGAGLHDGEQLVVAVDKEVPHVVPQLHRRDVRVRHGVHLPP